MRFSLHELHFIFSEIRRVLKSKGLNFFSVRNHNDKSYGKGVEVDKGIYDVNGFLIRFFTEKEIQGLAAAEGFEVLWIKEEYGASYTLSCIQQGITYFFTGNITTTSKSSTKYISFSIGYAS